MIQRSQTAGKMKIVQRHSHLNGYEYLMYHKPRIWKEIENAIRLVDAEKCRTKRSKEKRKAGRILYSPIKLNTAFDVAFSKKKWKQRRTTNWLCQDIELVKKINRLPP